MPATPRPNSGTTVRPGDGSLAPGHTSTVLAAGRAFAARSFTDSCTIQRRFNDTTNLVNGAVTKTYTTVYTGPCRVQAASANWAGPTEVAGAALRLASLQLQLPLEGTGDLRIDDLVTILACRNEPALVGRQFTVTGESRKSDATMRKLPLLEVLS